jgi:hypothetical protein
MFCVQCGAVLEPNARFCGFCGKLVNLSQTTSQTSPPINSACLAYDASPNVEQVSEIINEGIFRKKSFGRLDTIHLIITNRRLIFAIITQQTEINAVKQAYQEARQNGQTRLSASGESLGAEKSLVARYQSIPLDSVTRENPDNLALNIDKALKITIKQGPMVHPGAHGNGNMEIYAAGDKYEFGIVDRYRNEIGNALKRAGIDVEY